MQHRQERVSDAIREKVARVVVEELRDPKIGFVSVTRCSLSRDRKIATVYFSVLGDEATRKQSMEHLDRARGYVRRQIARTLNMRYTPELRFAFDDLREHELRVHELLGEALPEPPRDDEEAAADPPPDSAEPGPAE